MDDLGLNDWLKEAYGTTIDGLPLFKLIWSTNVTEMRKGTFRDYYGEVIIREVTEVRECLKYPLAQERWILEVIKLVPESIYGIELFTKWTYEGIYTFQDKDDNYLELSREMLEVAMYLFFLYGKMTWNERLENRMKDLALKEKEKKEKIRQLIGQNMRSPLYFVME